MVGSCEREAQILDSKDFLYKMPFSEVQTTNLYETRSQLARLNVAADPCEQGPEQLPNRAHAIRQAAWAPFCTHEAVFVLTGRGMRSVLLSRRAPNETMPTGVSKQIACGMPGECGRQGRVG